MSGAPDNANKEKRRTRSARTLVTLRIIATALFFCAFAAGFLGAGRVFDLIFTAFGATQLFPGIVRIAGNALGGVIGGTAAATLSILILSMVFGRFYCSSLCPLGAAQDAAAHAGHRRGKHRHGKTYSYTRGVPFVRAAAFAAVPAAFVVGASSLAGFLDPYSLAARFLQYAIVPLFFSAANLLEPLARNFDLFWANDFPGFSIWATAASASAVSIILILAFFRGRFFCNTLCPVGSILGLLNRAAVFRVRLDEQTCVSCGGCARVCKAECLDTENRRLDASRCVSCFSCLDTCPKGALRYGRARRKIESAHASDAPGRDASVSDPARRAFLRKAGTGGAGVVLALAANPIARAAETVAPNLTPLAPASPPGAVSLKRFLSACTGCGLCVSKCPAGVLRPSIARYGPRGFLMPYLDYDASYCQYECTLCTDLCPTGALRKLTLEEKKLTQMGTAALVTDKCIVFTKKTACGACAEHCPTGSVRMVPSPTGIPEPLFDKEICVGCGACHHICPAEPEKAITVTGKTEQGTALPPTKNLFGNPESAPPAAPQPIQDKTKNGDFPF